MERQLELFKSAAEHALSAAEAVAEHLEDGEEKTAALLELRDVVYENAELTKSAAVSIKIFSRLVGEEQEGDEDEGQVTLSTLQLHLMVFKCTRAITATVLRSTIAL
jgi:hypothetical protein